MPSLNWGQIPDPASRPQSQGVQGLARQSWAPGAAVSHPTAGTWAENVDGPLRMPTELPVPFGAGVGPRLELGDQLPAVLVAQGAALD
jgi:hypothetical protein